MSSDNAFYGKYFEMEMRLRQCVLQSLDEKKTKGSCHGG